MSYIRTHLTRVQILRLWMGSSPVAWLQAPQGKQSIPSAAHRRSPGLVARQFFSTAAARSTHAEDLCTSPGACHSRWQPVL